MSDSTSWECQKAVACQRKAVPGAAKEGGKKRREQVCHTPPARTANPSLLTYILARGTLAAAMTPIRALASSTTPLSTHLSPALHDQP